MALIRAGDCIGDKAYTPAEAGGEHSDDRIRLTESVGSRSTEKAGASAAECRVQAKAAARSVTGAAVVLLSSRVDSSALRRLLMGGFPTRQQCLG
jgi:hypothetical protein